MDGNESSEQSAAEWQLAARSNKGDEGREVFANITPKEQRSGRDDLNVYFLLQ